MAGDPVGDHVSRTFLALPLAEIFLNELQPLIGQMQKKINGVKWVLPAQVHITLHFFGKTTAEQIKIIREIVQPITERYLPFHLGLEGIGFFPNLHKPRVIWVGISGESEAFIQLQGELQTKIGKAGFPIEERSFRAHATIGRIKEKFGDREKQFKSLDLENLPHIKTEARLFDKIVLFQSFLSSEGSHYEALETFHLSSKPSS